MAIITKSTNNKCWRHCGEALYNVGRNVNWCNYHGKQYRSSLKEIKTELSYDPAIPHLAIYPEKNENTNSKRYTYPNVNSTIYKSQDKEVTCVSINRCMDEDVVCVIVCVCI